MPELTLREAAGVFLEKYVELINSGDCGNWNPEEEQEVIDLHKALAQSHRLSDTEIKEIAYEYGSIFEGAEGVQPKCDMLSLNNLYNYTNAVLDASEKASR